ncbi:MAG TPA: hypothetical protein VHD15_14650, partial [Hyphomicrobiales bacterium]|nr:hypothetical protein [Hyphomicrobiales bacterium]
MKRACGLRLEDVMRWQRVAYAVGVLVLLSPAAMAAEDDGAAGVGAPSAVTSEPAPPVAVPAVPAAPAADAAAASDGHPAAAADAA